MKSQYGRGMLKARPGIPDRPDTYLPGEHPLGSPGSVLYVPTGYQAATPAPMLLLLHGAGGTGASMLPAFRAQADATGTLLLAPNSRQTSWDVIHGGYGPDVQEIDRRLNQVFTNFAVDPKHMGIAGFSDGASYALSLGIINGELFSHVLAFAPGFLVPTHAEDSPHLFIAHGTADRILPIDNCSRKIVPSLRQAGYHLDYQEFEGGHVLPDAMVAFAFRCFMSPS